MAEQVNATTVAPKTYLELISQDPETKKQENLIITAQEAHLDLSRSIISLEQELAKAKLRLEKAKRAVPYKAEEEYATVVVINKLNKKLEYYKEIKAERFKDALV